MLNRDEFEILFASWKMQFGVEKTSKRGTVYHAVPSNSTERKTMLRYLISTLVETNGYKESDFGQYLKNLIVDQCVNTESPDKKRLTAWKAASYKDVNDILAEVFGKSFVENATRVKRSEKAPAEQEHQDDFYPDNTSYDEEEVVLTKPMKDDMFKGMPDIHYPMLTHEELVAKLEKEIAEREENGDE